jgi:hypothetical protein
MIDQVTTLVTRRKQSSGGPLEVGGPGHVPSVPVGKDGPEKKNQVDLVFSHELKID